MGGTSIESLFKRNASGTNGFQKTVLRHANLSQCHKYCHENKIENPSTVFIVLRNRYEQLFSSWRWLCRKKKDLIGPKTYTTEEYTFSHYIKNLKLIHSRSTLHNCDFHESGTYVFDKNNYAIANIRPIAKINYWTNNDPNVIKLRLSAISDDFNSKVAPLINFPCQEIPHLNKNKKINNFSLRNEDISIIEDIYGEEISAYEYSVPDYMR